MTTVIVFDLNGTLFDLSALDSQFAQLTGPAGPSASVIRDDWFSRLERLWLTELATGSYTEFDKLAQTALRMTVDKWGLSTETVPHKAKGTEESTVNQLLHAATDALGIRARGAGESVILDQLNALPAFPDVVPGLGLLKQAGFRLGALTNGTEASAKTLLQRAGLTDYFEQVLSVDKVKRYKPARQAYELASSRLDINLDLMLLVSAHDWDIAGANAAGCSTAFLQRPGQVLNPKGSRPDAQATNLMDLAQQIIRQNGR